MSNWISAATHVLQPNCYALAGRLVLLAVFAVSSAALAAEQQPDARSRSEEFSKQIQPLLNRLCLDCHGPDYQEAEINLALYDSPESILKHRESWGKISEMLQFGAMPPDGSLQPTEAERELLVTWIHGMLTIDCDQIRDPGRVTLRRLNRAEYDNTIRDLTGLDLNLARDFPSDDVGEGFDNIGDVLSLPPLLMEKYLDAAVQVAEQMVGPVDVQPDESAEKRNRVLIAVPGEGRTPRDAARVVLDKFATRAFRRPVQPEELERLVGLTGSVLDGGSSFEEAIQVALTAVLVSPHFLFRVEDDRTGDVESPIRELNDFELASRLSYFLWSSMPDDELFALASRGELRQEPVLVAQVRRMIADPKSASLVDQFAAQWLNLRNLEEVTPDPNRFPGFDADLKRAMRRETELLFDAVMREDLRITEFLTADFTFVNQRLSEHYGIEGVQGDAFRRVGLPADQRIGLLTQASILTLTSNPTRTSAVKRGKWIMENILGTPPPDPPPNVPELEEAQRASQAATLREQLVLHRQNAVCASCHVQMDELGFGFENFDPIGRWRELDGGKPVDSAGELPSGERFQGPIELVKILSQRDKAFAEALARKMLTYALGRGLQYYDQCAVDSIVQRMQQHDYRFSSLVLGIVTSEPFRMRRTQGENE